MRPELLQKEGKGYTGLWKKEWGEQVDIRLIDFHPHFARHVPDLPIGCRLLCMVALLEAQLLMHFHVTAFEGPVNKLRTTNRACAGAIGNSLNFLGTGGVFRKLGEQIEAYVSPKVSAVGATMKAKIDGELKAKGLLGFIDRMRTDHPLYPKARPQQFDAYQPARRP